jgi:dTDP-4-dehydrorhamnose 3,5-epimerase
MLVLDTDIPEVKLIKPKSHGDSRGFFLETFQKERYKEMGIDHNFIQDNHSRSKKNTLRGLHYQSKNMQGKLVRVSRGSVYDVAVDIRKGSPTYKKWVAYVLNDENHHQLFIPPGFAHGFCVLSDYADFEYKCTDLYSPNYEVGLQWSDPELDIDWPISNPLVSEKDKANPLLKNLDDKLLPIFIKEVDGGKY